MSEILVKLGLVLVGCKQHNLYHEILFLSINIDFLSVLVFGCMEMGTSSALVIEILAADICCIPDTFRMTLTFVCKERDKIKDNIKQMKIT